MPRRIDYTNKTEVQQRQGGSRPLPTLQDKDLEKQFYLVHQRCDDIQKRVLPDCIDFYNIQLSGAATVYLCHDFGGPVNFRVVDSIPNSATPALVCDRHYPLTDNPDPGNKLMLDLSYDGVLTIRVERIQ